MNGKHSLILFLIIHFRKYTGTIFVSTGFVVILIQSEASVSTREYPDIQAFRILFRLCSTDLIGHHQNTACFCKNRDTVQSTVHIHHSSTLIAQTCINIIPYPIRQPYCCLCYIKAFYSRCCHSRYHQLVSEKVLIFYRICLRCLRIFIIHGLHQRKIFLIASVVHCIKIRHHSVALTESFFHNNLCLLFETPRLFSIEVTA